MTPLVLVHGFMGGSEQWALQAPLDTERTLIAIDLPGFGENADMAPISSIQAFAQWVLSAVPVERFDLLGHSMGGMIVQEMVRLAPKRIARLVLYGTGELGALPDRFEPIETSMRRAQEDGASATARRIAATWFLDREDAQEYAACAAIAQRCTLPAILSGLSAMRDWSGRDQLADIQAPTLVLWGDSDRTYAWAQTEELWRGIATAQLAVAPGCAHAMHLEKPKLFNALVQDFLQRP